MLKQKMENFIKEVKDYDLMMKEYIIKGCGDSIAYMDGNQFEMIKSCMKLVQSSIELSEAFTLELAEQTEMLKRIESRLSK